MIATHLVYAAAGNPEREDFRPIAGPCWWCGCASPTGRGWPLSRLSDSFQGAELARTPTSEVICAPCAWTLAVGFRLPRAYAVERIAEKAQQGRRVDLAGGKFLVLLLADGRAGLWETASGGREAPWTAAIAELREAPRDVGPCRYLGAHALESLEPGEERFIQAFHHFVVDGVWSVCTDADKPRVRTHLLRDDIVGPAVTSLVTTQGKHTLIHTPVEYPETGTRTVYFGGPLSYQPRELAELLHAVEKMRRTGASQDEIASGDYAGRGFAWLFVSRLFDPVIAPHRGGRLLDLALYLCRSYPELVALTPVVTEIAHVGPEPDPDPRGPVAPPTPAAAPTGDPPPDRRERPARQDGIQLRLF